MKNPYNISLITKYLLGILMALAPATCLNAFTEGEGEEDDPFIVTSDDSTLDVASYYLIEDSIDFGSTDFYVGYKTTDNYLTITGSDTVIEGNNAYIGYESAAEGTVVLTNKAEWSPRWFYIGMNGTGTLYCENESVLSGYYMYVGCLSGSVGKLILNDSSLTATNVYIASESSSVTCGSGSFYIQNGSSAEISKNLYVGGGGGFARGSDDDRAILIVTGEGSNIYGSSLNIRVGEVEDSSVTVEDGAAISDSNSVFGSYYSTTDVLVKGAGTSWVNSSDIEMIGENVYFRIEDGATVSCDGFTTYNASTDVVASMSLSGEGTLFVDNGALSIATNEGQFDMILGDGAMLVTSGAITIGDEGAIYLSGGYWAVYGKTTAKAAAAGYNLKVYDDGDEEWVAASSDDLTATYIDGTTNTWAACSLYSTYGGKVDLTGYTILTGGGAYLGWSDCGAVIDGWNESSWYGYIYADTTWGGWIYQENHGWQYATAADDGLDGVYLYDCATGDWWYSNGDLYPYLYDYTAATWLYYYSGTTPDRKFWDYATGSLVDESDL